MTWKTHRRVVNRRNEGKSWHIIDEADGILLIETWSKRYGTKYLRMRRSDYENTEIYPKDIPGFTLDKVF